MTPMSAKAFWEVDVKFSVTPPIALCALLSFLAAPSMAETVKCSFTTECYEAEACSETAFDLSIEDADGKTAIVTDARTIPTSIGGSEAVRIYVGVTDDAFHLISRASGGATRYTTHIYEGPMMVNYLGTCKGEN